MRIIVGFIATLVSLVSLLAANSLLHGATTASADSSVQVSIAALGSAAPNSDFTARVNISQVADFDASNYDVSFDANVLRLDQVTGGQIGTTIIPVEWNKISSGTYKIVQNVPGFAGVNGSGYLAELHFHVIGSDGTSSRINLSNGVLANKLANEIFASWTWSSVNVAGVGGGPPPAPFSPPIPAPNVSPQTKTTGVVDDNGFYINNFITRSEDGKIQLTINKDTRSLTKEKAPASQIVIRPAELPAPLAKNFAAAAPLYDFGPDGTTFDPPISLTFTYDVSRLPEGTVEKELKIAWWDKVANEWVMLADSVVDTSARTVSASVNHFTVLTVLGKIAQPPLPVFNITNLVISPTAVKAGEKVTIGALVYNSGNADGSYTVTLKIVGKNESQTVNVAAGSSKQVSFTVPGDAIGTHTVDVNGLTGSFRVERPALDAVTPAPPMVPAAAPIPAQTSAPAPAPAPIEPESDTTTNRAWLWGAIGGTAFLVVVFVIYFWYRRKLND